VNSEKPIDNQHLKRNADTESNHPIPEVSGAAAQPQANPSPHGHKTACNKNRDWVDKTTLGLEGFGLLVLIVYTIFTGLMYRSNKQAADAASSASKTAASQLEMSERPWIDADISVDGPFDFNVNGANIHLKFLLTNSGHSPAFTTYIAVMPADTFMTGTTPTEFRDQACKEATVTVTKYASSGVTIFPNRTFEQRRTVTFTNEEISQKHGSGTKIPNYIQDPSAVACIGYRPSFNSAIYHTAYIYDLKKADASGKISDTFKVGESVAQTELRLLLDPLDSINAD
jgi:hypothetical protein